MVMMVIMMLMTLMMIKSFLCESNNVLLQVPLIPPPYGEKTEQDLSIKFFKPLEHFVRLLEYF